MKICNYGRLVLIQYLPLNVYYLLLFLLNLGDYFAIILNWGSTVTCIKAEAKTNEYRDRNDIGWLPHGNQYSSHGIHSDNGIQIGDKLWLVLDSSHDYGMDLLDNSISKYYHLLT